MLQLDDAAIACIFRASQHIAPAARSRMLRRFASTADPSPTALRSRRARARQRKGERVFRIVLDEVAIEHMLAADNLLPADPTHEQTEQALTEFLRRLAALAAA
jgi:hypothetical protein